MYATYSSTLKLLVPACLLEDGVGVELFWCFYFGFGCFGFGFFFSFEHRRSLVYCLFLI